MHYHKIVILTISDENGVRNDLIAILGVVGAVVVILLTVAVVIVIKGNNDAKRIKAAVTENKIFNSKL